MDTENNSEQGIVPQEEKKRQKPGLNAVRPNDYVEHKFKDMAKEENLSQTEFFERLFWNYLKVKDEEERQDALNLGSEINLISKDLNSILLHFKSIAERAQDTILSLKANAEQAETNRTLEIDTLNKTVEALAKRNEELEKSNRVFHEVKAGLESKLLGLEELNSTLKKEVKARMEELQEKDKKLQEADRTINALQKEVLNGQNEVKKLIRELSEKQDDMQTKDLRIRTLEQAISGMSDTLNTMDTLKKAEIASIEAKYLLTITELEKKLSEHDENKARDILAIEEKYKKTIEEKNAQITAVEDRNQKEIDALRKTLKSEYEASKKLAIAQMKLDLAEMNSKYAEAVRKLDASKQKNTE